MNEFGPEKREKNVESDNPVPDISHIAKLFKKYKVVIDNPKKFAQKISLQIQDLHLENSINEQTINSLLAAIEKKIKTLKKRYPRSKDIYYLEQSLKDLRSDFEKGENLELDSSMRHIVENMPYLISAASVKVSKSNDVLTGDSALSKKLQKLKELGIDIDYVVSNGKKNNKTVIYFPQVHPISLDGIEVDKQVIIDKAKRFSIKIRSSQNKIAKIISKCTKNGLGKHVFAEFLSEKEMDHTSLKTELTSGISLVKAFKKDLPEHFLSKINSDIYVSGFDPITLKMKWGEQHLSKKNKDHKVEKQDAILLNKIDEDPGSYRMTAHNVFAASSLASRLLSDDLSYVTFGAGHEYLFVDKNLNGSDEKHPLPFSEAMAYYTTLM